MNKPYSSLLEAIRSRRAEIQNIRTSLDAEDQELATAERVAERLEPTLLTQPAGKIHALTGQSNVHPAGKIKQSDLVIMTMRSAAQPWFESSSALGDEIKRIHGVEIKQNSLFPLISVLRAKGTIVREGQKIALAERINKSHGQHELEGGSLNITSDLPTN